MTDTGRVSASTMSALWAAEAAATHNTALGLLREQDEQRFRASAIAYAEASTMGAADVAIGAAVRERADAMGLTAHQRRELITSSAGCGFHRRTGAFLKLRDDLSADVSARDVQALIKKLPTAVVDDCLRRSTTQAECHSLLRGRVASRRGS